MSLLMPSLRQGRIEDTPYLARVMYESMLPGAGRGIFDSALSGTGVDPIAFHQALLSTGANNWGQIDSFIILEADGDPQAAMGAFLGDMPDMRPLTGEGFAAVCEALRWPTAVARGFWREYVSFFGLFGTSPQLVQPAQYVLEYAAVEPAFRGRGLHRRLLEAHADYARRAGYSTMGTTAVFGNVAVMKSYGKFGFVEAARFGPEYYNDRYPGMIRYVYTL
jgi:GNAT superfamily N-acetyltransferase